MAYNVILCVSRKYFANFWISFFYFWTLAGIPIEYKILRYEGIITKKSLFPPFASYLVSDISVYFLFYTCTVYMSLFYTLTNFKIHCRILWINKDDNHHAFYDETMNFFTLWANSSWKHLAFYVLILLWINKETILFSMICLIYEKQEGMYS